MAVAMSDLAMTARCSGGCERSSSTRWTARSDRSCCRSRRWRTRAGRRTSASKTIHVRRNGDLDGLIDTTDPSLLLLPARTADKKEHENLFERRRREWKRVRAGDLRMFTNESLHGAFNLLFRFSGTGRLTDSWRKPAGKTVTVYSAKEMYHQLSLYAQR